jgi:hypothetical protein
MYGLALFDTGDRDAAFRELARGLEVFPGDLRIQGAIAYLSTQPAPAPSLPSDGSAGPGPTAEPPAAPPAEPPVAPSPR